MTGKHSLARDRATLFTMDIDKDSAAPAPAAATGKDDPHFQAVLSSIASTDGGGKEEDEAKTKPSQHVKEDPTDDDDEDDDVSHASVATDKNNDVEVDDDDDEEEEDKGDSQKPNVVYTPTKKEASAEAPSPSSTADASLATTDNSEPPKKKKRFIPQVPVESRRGRTPAVAGLTIPFRTVKKAMKMDPANSIVQNEAAVMTTKAAELFLQRLAKKAESVCETRKRSVIRYEDIAEARADDPALAFLASVMP